MRVTSTGFSVPTGLAIETIVDIPRLDSSREVPKPVKPIAYYDTFYVNILTLIRNAIHSVPTLEQPYISASDIADFCASELFILSDILPIKVVGYISTYKKLLSREAKPFVREHSTPKQKVMSDLTNKSAMKMVKNLPIEQYTWTLPSTHAKIMLLTHLVADLYSYKSQSDIALLESNTGTVKTVSQFSSKFYNIPKEVVPYIPFNLKSNLILGDNNIIKPMAGKVRKEFLAAALDKKWTPNTSEKRVYTDLIGKYDLAYSFYSQLPDL